MISKEELEEIIKSVLNRGARKYITQSGAFLEILIKFSCEKRIEDIADANSIYTNMYPTVANFIAAMLPGILVNHYFADLKDFPFESFIEWLLNEPGWEKPIKDNFTNKERLTESVESIINSVTKFQKDKK